jgi:hypothetical protein
VEDASAAYRWSTGATPPFGHSIAPLSASAATALRCWLQAQHRAHAEGTEVDRSEVRRAMHRLGVELRARGGRVEHAIVLLKELWANLPPDAAVDAPGSRYGRGGRAVIDEIVRACIEEFYAPADGGSAPGVAAPSDASLSPSPAGA